VQADDLAPALGVHGRRDYCRHGDDAAALAHLEVGGVEPQVGPLAVEGALEKGVLALVDLLAQLGDLRLGDARQAHGLDEVVHAPSGDAPDPRLLDHGQGLLGGLAGLQEGREVASLAELGDAELERAEAGVERAVPVSVAVVGPLGAALVAAGADHALHVRLHQDPLHVRLHQDLQHALRHGPEEVAVAGLLQQLHECHSVVGHRGLRWAGGEASQLHLSSTARWSPRCPTPGDQRIPTTSTDTNGINLHLRPHGRNLIELPLRSSVLHGWPELPKNLFADGACQPVLTGMLL